MEMKKYLIDTFSFNDSINKMMLGKIKELKDKEKCIQHFSHIINSQNKWLARILQYPKDPGLDWWIPVYHFNQLEIEWNKSLGNWINFLESKKENELFEEVKFIGYDGRHWSVTLKDIPLQLNYHSIHHRAQMQLFIREQGLEPDFIDYIGTKYKRI